MWLFSTYTLIFSFMVIDSVQDFTMCNFTFLRFIGGIMANQKSDFNDPHPAKTDTYIKCVTIHDLKNAFTPVSH